MSEVLCHLCGRLRPKRIWSWQRFTSIWSQHLQKQRNVFSQRPAEQRVVLRSLCTSTVTDKWEKPVGYDSGIKVYHPIVKDKVPLILKQEKLAQWYACGPTVYDHSHIGHASSYVRLDIIRRIMGSAFDIDTTFVMGVTDIDDKIIQKSHETGRDWHQLTQLYESEFFFHLASLNVSMPSVITRVTDHIPHIVDFVRTIQDKGLAYTVPDGSVYFDVKKYSKYGVFARNEKTVTEKGSGKKNSQDFALWKGSKSNEPSWESPWGKGRPGWHVECSAMASGIFGSNFDLHSGGEDLMFPHHENELAQSAACHGHHQWVNYWIHTGHLFLPGQSNKMSKSLKNTISVPQLLEEYTPNQFRMLCLLTNYRKKIEFSESRMDKAVSTMNALNSLIKRCEAYVHGQIDCGEIPEAELYEKLHSTRQTVFEAFADDFNTPKALASLVRLVKFTNQLLGEEADKDSQESKVRSNAPVAAVGIYTKRLLKQLGLDIGRKMAEEDTETHLQFFKAVESIVRARSHLRDFARDKQFVVLTAESVGIPKDQANQLMKKLYFPLWKVSDDLRKDILQSANVQINDTETGSTWSIVDSKKSSKAAKPSPVTITLSTGSGDESDDPPQKTI